MGEVITIGLDIAKSVFQVHGVDDVGTVLIRKRVSRSKMLEFFRELPPCLVGIEACPAAHHWGRELQAFGHTVKLMPPSYVKAYLKRSKNDANDAAAICEAGIRGPIGRRWRICQGLDATRSRASFRFPQRLSLRSAKTRGLSRFSACITPIRACIVGPRPSAAMIKTSTAVCHFS
jgi:transposase